VVGVIVAIGGLAIGILAVLTWPFPYLTAAPGFFVMGYGITLVLACAYYDDVDITTIGLGVKIKVRRRRDRLPR
jgi:hypothetical protein